MQTLRFTKEKAIELRKAGLSIREIEKLSLIPRSTLSGWFKNVALTQEQQQRLHQNAQISLLKARLKASAWHKAQKETRLLKAKAEAEAVINQINLDENVIELAMAMLYLGEGAKKNTTAIGNSNPVILKFFLTVLLNKYRIDPSKIKCDLHLRADQDPDEAKSYWSKELNLPLSNFRSVLVDLRTTGVATFPDYKGVCLINCGSIAIQRRLICLYNLFCQKVIEEWPVKPGLVDDSLGA